MESIFLPLPMNLLPSFWENGGESPPFALPSLLASSQLSLIFLRQTAARAMSNTNRHTARPTVTHRATGGNVTFWPEENGGEREGRASLFTLAQLKQDARLSLLYPSPFIPPRGTLDCPLCTTDPTISITSLTAAASYLHWVWRSELSEETEPFLCALHWHLIKSLTSLNCAQMADSSPVMQGCVVISLKQHWRRFTRTLAPTVHPYSFCYSLLICHHFWCI